MAAITRTGPGQNSGMRNIISVSQMSGRDPNTWIIFHCFPKCLIQELDHKWNSRVSNRCPNGMLISQIDHNTVLRLAVLNTERPRQKEIIR